MKVKRIISILLAFIMIVSVDSISLTTVSALDYSKVNAGETATITCYGNTAAQITNFIFEDAGCTTVAKITHFDKYNNIIYERESCGSFYYCPDVCCKGGEHYTIEVYYGAVRISYNTANTAPPSIIVEKNNKEINPLVKTNISEIYLTVGDTANFDLSYVAPGFYAEKNRNAQYGVYSSRYEDVAVVDKDGLITAVGVGETTIKMNYVFGFSASNCFSGTVECKVHVLENYNISEANEKYYSSSDDKYFNVIAMDNQSPRTTGFDIKIGDDITNTGEDYQTIINIPQSNKNDILITKEGYIDYTLKNKYISSYNWITLFPENDGSVPFFQAVYARESTQKDWQNLKVKSLNIYENSNAQYYIDVEVNWGKKIKREVYIEQGDVNIPVIDGSTGAVALGEVLRRSDEPVYVCAKTADGRVFKSQLMINIYTPEEYISLDFGDNGGITTQITENVDVLKDFPFTLKLGGSVPVKMSIDSNGKVKGSIGLKNTAFKNEYTYYDDIKQTVGKMKIGGDEFSTNNSEYVEDLIKRIKKCGGEVATSKQSVGISCDVSLIGYFEGRQVNGRVEITEMGILCNISSDVNYSCQSIAFNVPYYWQVGFGAELESTLIAGEKNESGSYEVKIPEATLKFNIYGSLSVGIDKIAGAGAKLKGELKIKFPSEKNSASNSIWTIDVGFSVIGQILGLEFNQEVWKPVDGWQIYPYEEYQYSSGIDIADMLTDDNSYTQPSRSYLKARNKSVLLEDGFSKNSIFQGDSVLKVNTYADARPQIVSLEDETIMVWLDDSWERAAANKTRLNYCIFDNNTETWSDVKIFENDEYADYNPVLTAVGNKVYLLWQKSTEIMSDDATITEIAKNLDIYISEYNRDNHMFSEPQSVSGKNNVLDMMPKIAEINNIPTVVWVQNDENNIFGSEGKNTICCAVYENGNWVKKTVIDNLNSICGISVINDEGDMSIFYSADTDGIFATSEDVEIFNYKKENVTQITHNNVADLNPQVSNGKVLWYADGNITDGNMIIPVLSDTSDFSYITSIDAAHEAIIYIVYDGYKSNVYANINKGDGWSAPIKVSEEDSICQVSCSGTFDPENNLVCAANTRDIIDDESAELGNAMIKTYYRTDRGDLSMVDVTYDNYSLGRGGNLSGAAIIENTGTKTAKAVTVKVYEDNNEIYSSDVSVEIRPGESAPINFYCPVSLIEQDRLEVFVSTDFFEEENLSNNSFTLPINRLDISIENSFAEINEDGSITVTSFIVNRGLNAIDNIDISYRDGKSTGALIGTMLLERIEPGEMKYIKYKTNNLNSQCVYIMADQLETENIIANNIDFAIVDSMPDNKNQVIVIEPENITEGAVEIDHMYYLPENENDKEYIAKFIPTESGFYRIKAVVSSLSAYPHIYISIKPEIDQVLYGNQFLNRHTYDRDNDEYLFISENGNYYNAGTEYTINFSVSKNSCAEVKIEKIDLPSAIEIIDDTMKFTEEGREEKIICNFNPEGTYGKLQFETEDELVAIVSDDGYVTPVLPGSTYINVSVPGTTITQKVLVIVNERDNKKELKIGIHYDSLEEGDYAITPEESGFYKYIFNDCYMTLYDEHWNVIGNIRPFQENMAYKYLESGHTYFAHISNSEYSTNGANGEIFKESEILSVETDEAMKLTLNSTRIFEFNTTPVNTYLDHSSTVYSIEDDRIAKITEKYSCGTQSEGYNYGESYIVLEGLQVGTTTLHIQTANDVEFSINIEVDDYEEISDRDVKNVLITDTSVDSIIYKFIPKEDTYYTIESRGVGRMAQVEIRNEDLDYCYLPHIDSNYSYSEFWNSDIYEFKSGNVYLIKFCGYSPLPSGINERIHFYDYSLSLNKTVYAEELKLSQDAINGFVGESRSLTYDLLPSYSFNEYVSWHSDNENIATVNDEGIVELVGIGSTTITAQSQNGLQAICNVTVASIPDLRLDYTYTINISNIGDSSLYSFIPNSDGIYVFSSLNNEYAMKGSLLDADMNEIISDTSYSPYTGFRIQCNLEAGRQYYLKSKFYLDDKTGSYEICASKLNPANTVYVKEGNVIEGYIGTSIHLSVGFLPENSIIENCTWTSSNEMVATVYNDGYVTCKTKGEAIVNVVSENGLTSSCKIIVKDYEPIEEGEETSAVIYSGGQYAYFIFSPEKEGDYTFYSISEDDTYGYILDKDMNELASDDDNGNNRNFEITYRMEAKTPYILKVRYYDDYNTGSFPIILERKTSVILGDVNSDGEVTMKDLIILKRYLAGGYNVSIAQSASDVNNDGEVTMKDVIILNRYLAGGWDVTLG